MQPIRKISLEKPILKRDSLPKLDDIESIRELHIEFSESFLMNSLGIQDWIVWLGPIARNPAVKIFLYKCPAAVVQQINLVVNFLPPNAEVASFYVPFFSDETGDSKMFLLEKDKHYSSGKITIPEVLDSNGNKMEMDVTPKVYFRFLGLTP